MPFDLASAKPVSGFDLSTATPVEKKIEPKKEVTAADRVGAVGSGFNRGVSGLLGLPVDTALNIWDLGKAGAGYLQSKFTGHAPSEIFDPTDRSQYTGSGDWISKQFDKTPYTTTQMSRPDDTMSRYLYAGGAGLPSILTTQPENIPQALSAAGRTIAPAIAGQAASEAFPDNPSASILASMLTQAAPSAINEGSKYLAQRKTDAATAKAAQVLQNEGIDLDAAQSTGNHALQKIKSALYDNPMTASSQVEKSKQQIQQYTAAVLKKAGINSPLATADVMGDALDTTGGRIGDISARTPIKYTPQLHQDLQDVIDKASRTLPENEVNILKNQMDFLQKNAQATPNGVMIPGETLKGAHTEIGSVIGRGGPLANVAGQMQSVLDDAVQQSATPQDAQLLKQSRQQYRALLQIGKAIDKQGDGLIYPNKLVNAITSDKTGKKQYFYERGDQRLVDLAKAGNKILPDRMPNSGTPMRQMMHAAPAAVLTGMAHLGAGNPIPLLAGAAGYLAAPKIGQMLINSPTALQGKFDMPLNTQLQFATQNATNANKRLGDVLRSQ